MKSLTHQHWLFIHLHCLLGRVVDSSPLFCHTHLQSIQSKVGEQVVLPCSWKQPLGHIQWKTPAETVFEQRGERRWQAAEYEGRVEVPEEKLGSGDCSLIISDTQIGDTGRYESFMLVDGGERFESRVFIQSVRLSVFGHTFKVSRLPGEDLVVELFTRHSVRIVFQGRNSSEWSDLWMRQDDNSDHLEKHPSKDQVTVKRLKSSDEGTYKVLDEQGLATSTVQLSVGEGSSAVRHSLDTRVAAGGAANICSSALLLFTGLVTTFQTPHLL